MDKFIGEGSIVTILYVDLDDTATYKVVSKKNREEGEILGDSPLGQALINYGEENKTITIKPEKEEPFKVKILKIENPVSRKSCVIDKCIQPTPLTELEQRIQILEKRNIKQLIHFTRLENLQSILMRGIWSKQSLENYAKDFSYTINDKERLDGKPYCSSFSISHHNYKMLFHLKTIYPQSKWVILSIDPQILLDENRYLFSSTGNAAQYNGGNVISDAIGLQKIFLDEVSEQVLNLTRAQLRLHDSEPTNPQAEILLSRKVEPKYIKKVVFETHEDYSIFISRYGDYKLEQFAYEIDDENEMGNSWFEPRHDYKYWQKREE
jgi:hypothetical protein